MNPRGGPFSLGMIELIVSVGTRRELYALRHKLGGGAAEINRRECWGHQIVSAGAELLVARHVGEFWNAYVGDPALEPADVGDSTEVRWADGLDGRTSLIVRPEDKPGRSFYLVLGVDLYSLRVVGWLPIGAAKRDEWKFAPNGRAPAWFVPLSALWPTQAKEMTT